MNWTNFLKHVWAFTQEMISLIARILVIVVLAIVPLAGLALLLTYLSVERRDTGLLIVLGWALAILAMFATYLVIGRGRSGMMPPPATTLDGIVERIRGGSLPPIPDEPGSNESDTKPSSLNL